MPSRSEHKPKSLLVRAWPLVLVAVSLTAVVAGTAMRRRCHPQAPARSHSDPWHRAIAALAPVEPPAPPEPSDEELDREPETLQEQREALFARMKHALALDDESLAAVRTWVEKSPVMSQGNPKLSKHPMKRSDCRRIRKEAGLPAAGHPMCGARNMVPIYDPTAGETERDAKVCIDQYEFPDIPCEYPLVFARANQAAELCRAIGKRICDAHEWEGACAGALKPPDQEYVWGPERIETSYKHNKTREIVWAYGTQKDHSKCATGSRKTPHCGGSYTGCGSNTYPAGAFPQCVSKFGVYDQHGNAAEHMNLPLRPEEMASTGNLGSTEMKGSWFIFLSYEAHEDDCRWRAYDWHGTRVMDPESHRNYHLGFRCCKDVKSPTP